MFRFSWLGHQSRFDVPLLTHLRESQNYIRAAETGLGLFELALQRALFGLGDTPCIGLSDQEPAMLVDGVAFTDLTPARVAAIVAALKGQERDTGIFPGRKLQHLFANRLRGVGEPGRQRNQAVDVELDRREQPCIRTVLQQVPPDT